MGQFFQVRGYTLYLHERIFLRALGKKEHFLKVRKISKSFINGWGGGVGGEGMGRREVGCMGVY